MSGRLTHILFQLGRCLLRKQSVQKFKELVHRKECFDAIIVPGVPFRNGSWDAIMKVRVLWSCFLYKEGFTRKIIYSGNAVYSPYYEAVIMGLYAQKLGIPPEDILYETLAEHSTENIFYSYRLARQHGFKSIALATDPAQSFLLYRFTQYHFATPVIHIPIVEKQLKKIAYPTDTINPGRAYKPDFVSLIKRESICRRWKGTLGKNIPWTDKYKRVEDEL